MEITISSRTEGKVPVKVFHLKGDLDMKSHQDLENRAREEFATGDSRYAILDLTEVRYISSAGLRAIHAIFNFLREGDSTEVDALVHKGMRDGAYKSKHLKLVNPSKNVLQVITMAGYDMFMDIHPNVESALRSFSV
jgi:anti-anti-sigma factor